MMKYAFFPNSMKMHPFPCTCTLQIDVTLRLTIMRPSRQVTPRPGASALGTFLSARVVLDASFRAYRVCACLTHISVLTEYTRSEGNVGINEG